MARLTSHLLSVILWVMASGLPAVADTDVIELNTTTYPPLSTPEQQGFLDRIVKEALARLGITMKTVRLPAERALIDANHGIL
ncbi:MAG: hypothetical protein PVF34_09650, partial [Gammaproteobacteria bacterium]